MQRLFGWMLALAIQGSDGYEPTDRLIPPGWQGNPWGPVATKARETGQLPPLTMTPLMTGWDRWGRATLHDGDIVFRRGDARIAFGWFPFSRFIANASGSAYSHVGTVVIENGECYVYDTTKAGVRRQPFYVWVLDNVGDVGVKRLKPEYQSHVPEVVAYLHRTYDQQVPFDYCARPRRPRPLLRGDGREGVPIRRPEALRPDPPAGHGERIKIPPANVPAPEVLGDVAGEAALVRSTRVLPRKHPARDLVLAAAGDGLSAAGKVAAVGIGRSHGGDDPRDRFRGKSTGRMASDSPYRRAASPTRCPPPIRYGRAPESGLALWPVGLARLDLQQVRIYRRQQRRISSMDDPEEHALVFTALACGVGGCIEWKNEEIIRRVRSDANLAGLGPNEIRRDLVAYVRRSGKQVIIQREQKDEDFPDHPFFYVVIVPHKDIPDGIFVKLVLHDPDPPEYPVVLIVSLHKAGV